MNLVIFDCDGTLVDSQHVIVAAMNRAFAAQGLAIPPRQATLSVVGLSLQLACQRLLPERDDALSHRLAESYKAAFGELRADPAHAEPMFPGCRDAIEALARRDDVLLGIATGKSRRGVDALFDREGLRPYFATVQTADGHPSKPHPSMILTAMAETGVEADRVVMVGDTSFDIEMARAADVAALGVSWGYHPVEDLTDAGAHLVIDRYEDLEPALARLLKTYRIAAEEPNR